MYPASWQLLGVSLPAGCSNIPSKRILSRCETCAMTWPHAYSQWHMQAHNVNSDAALASAGVDSGAGVLPAFMTMAMTVDVACKSTCMVWSVDHVPWICSTGTQRFASW